MTGAVRAAHSSWQRCRSRVGSIADNEVRQLVNQHLPALFLAYEEALGLLSLYRECAALRGPIVDRRHDFAERRRRRAA